MQYPIIDLITSAYINNGWTGLDISTGKNLLNPEYEVITFNNINYYRNSPILFNAGTYTLSCNIQATGMYVNSAGESIFTKYSTTFLTFTLNEPKELYFDIYFRNGVPQNILCQLEIGTSATPYEPYNPNPSNDFSNRLKIPLLYYFPHPVIDALKRASDGTMNDNDKQILRHYLTPLGIGGI